MQHVDVLIVGAGLSGIGAAWHIQTLLPTHSYAILEARATMGGTWDLFRYPGIRSDSDMYTLGYRFRPWRNAKAIADGPSIRAYIEETAREYGIDRKIHHGHRVVRAEWSSSAAQWSVSVEAGEAREPRIFTCNFLYTCTGYYDYERGYTPEWNGMNEFAGPIVHPQQWPEALDYTGKRVVVIGSGATAVTLVPALAGRAAHVTMLQRSPSYVAALPARDPVANALRRVLPARTAYATTRWKNVLRSMFYYHLARTRPAVFKRALRKDARRALGDDFDVDTHFSPRYDPWDERLCIAPDGDLFAALRNGSASMVTDTIDTFTRTGIRLASGMHLDADIIVTATGLNLKLLSGMTLVVDGKPVDLAGTMAYRGMMFSDVPNLASAFGYTNASWTLKCDLVAEYVCRLLAYMAAHDYAQCTPRRNDPTVTEQPALDFTSGYVQRALDRLPRQGSKAPWKLDQNYVKDLRTLRFGRVDDEAMEFRARNGAVAAHGAAR